MTCGLKMEDLQTLPARFVAVIGEELMTEKRSIVQKAYAKVNLTLEILGKRRDGYHDLVSVMQTVNLFDTVTVSEADSIVVDCDDSEITADDNLVTKAAIELKNRAAISEGAKISVEKRIPVSAGLGGGSADAAATLRGLNYLWNLGLTDGDLLETAASVGSDVPFLIKGGTSLVGGRGEEVVPIPSAKIPKFLIVTPDVNQRPGISKTAFAFSRVDKSMYTLGNLTHKLAARIRSGGDCPPELFFNQFQVLAEDIYPRWALSLQRLNNIGVSEVILCGSGPSIFTVPPSKEIGTAWHLLLSTTYGEKAFLVEPVPSDTES